MNRFVRDLLAERWVEIARTGTFRASTGKVTITQDHLQEMADDYDPNNRVASLVIGHPSMLEIEGERKAHGIVAGLRVIGNSLQARFKNLSDEVKAGLRSGHWINRSIEATLKSPETERAYLFALALLGGSQPAIPAMLSAGDDNQITITTEIENSTIQPPNDKGASGMDESQVRAAIAEAIKPLETKIAELSGRPNIAPAEFAAMKEQVAKVDQLLEENKTLKASQTALEDQLAAAAVDSAMAGLPKALCSDEKKALMLSLFKTDKKTFESLKAENQRTAELLSKTMFSTLPVVKDKDGKDIPLNLANAERFTTESVELHQRAQALMAANPKLSYDDAVMQAHKETK